MKPTRLSLFGETLMTTDLIDWKSIFGSLQAMRFYVIEFPIPEYFFHSLKTTTTTQRMQITVRIEAEKIFVFFFFRFACFAITARECSEPTTLCVDCARIEKLTSRNICWLLSHEVCWVETLFSIEQVSNSRFLYTVRQPTVTNRCTCVCNSINFCQTTSEKSCFLQIKNFLQIRLTTDFIRHLTLIAKNERQKITKRHSRVFCTEDCVSFLSISRSHSFSLFYCWLRQN